MPKVVDPQERRVRVVEALWRLVRREGAAALSVRSVAAEAGLSVGAMRHYFASQEELIGFAAASMGHGVAARLAGREVASPGDAAAVLEELMPLDETRRAESEVWLELIVYARTRDELGRLSREVHEALRGICRDIVSTLRPRARGRERAERTAALHALVDGLTLHRTLYPELVSARDVTHAVRRHLADLAGR